MWLPPLARVGRTARERTLADVLERILDKGIIVDGDGQRSSGSMLSADDLIRADVPILGVRGMTPAPTRTPSRRVRKRKDAGGPE